jgi:hypothetical protein
MLVANERTCWSAIHIGLAKRERRKKNKAVDNAKAH